MRPVYLVAVIALLGLSPGSAPSRLGSVSWSVGQYGGTIQPVVVSSDTELSLKIRTNGKNSPGVSWRAGSGLRLINTSCNFCGLSDTIGRGMQYPWSDLAVMQAVPEREGPSTVSISIGRPVNERIDLQTFAYDSVAFGCGSENISFDGSGNARLTRLPTSKPLDLYGKRVDSQLPITCRGSIPDSFDYVLHVPNGATFIRYTNIPNFATIKVSQWRRAFELRAGQRLGALLIKTRDGRVAKILYLGGLEECPYLVAQKGKEFSDVTYYAPKLVKVLPKR